MHFARTKREVKRRIEDRRVGHERVVLAVLAAWIDAELFELAHGIERDRSSQPALVEMRQARRDDDGDAAACDELLDERSCRFAPDRQDRRQAMRAADAL